MRVAVVGHVEVVEFARVSRVPAAGEIVEVAGSFVEPAGGGAVAAVQLARLAGEALFLTAVGDDEVGRRAVERLEELGLRVRAAVRDDRPTRRGFTFLDDAGERTITVIGEKLRPHRDDDALPWDELGAMDAIFFVAGDPAGVRAARAARTLVATPRELAVLAEAGVRLDALVGSGRDPAEGHADGQLEPLPDLVVRTAGADGGTWAVEGGTRAADGGTWAVEDRTGTWAAAAPPGPIADAYGCGDSFAAGLTYGLGSGAPLEEALELAARCGAACLTGSGPYEGQLRLPS